MTPVCATATTNTANSSRPSASAEECGCSSLALSATVPLALGVLVASLQVVLWRARVVAQWLDEDAMRVWKHGTMVSVRFRLLTDVFCAMNGMMCVTVILCSLFNLQQMKLDCSDGEFHQSIIQSAIDRGTAALESSGSSNVTHDFPNYYQSNSSSGASSENDGNMRTFSPGQNEIEGNPPQKEMPKPKRMSEQVGGMASHKRPVLTLSDFILKPLRLLVPPRRNNSFGKEANNECITAVGKNDEGEETARHTANDDNVGGVIDETKAYRAVREVAFYEALKFASSFPEEYSGSISYIADVFRRVAGEKFSDGAMNAVGAREAVISLLSLCANAKHMTLPPAQPLDVSFMQSCRYPCVGCQRSSIFASNPLLSNLGYFNTLAFLTAFHARDPVVVSSLQSYARSWCALIKEMTSLKLMSEFTSPYFGVVDLDDLKQDGGVARGRLLQPPHGPHLLLRNLTFPFSRPNIIDIKMGTQTYEPAAPLSKRVREMRKYPQQTEIGFRIVGMRVHRPAADGGGCRRWDKSFGFSLKKKKEAMQALMIFFGCDGAGDGGSSDYHGRIIFRVIRQLSRIKGWFEAENSTLAFYASSILIVYDGFQNHYDCASELDDKALLGCQDPILKMIDFSHVCRGSGGDTGYLKGVSSLLSILEEIHDLISQ